MTNTTTTPDAATQALMPYDPYKDDSLTERQRSFLTELQSKLVSLKGALRAMRSESEDSLRRVTSGGFASYGMGDIYGQSVRNAERLNTEVMALSGMYRLLEIDKPTFAAAYLTAAGK